LAIEGVTPSDTTQLTDVVTSGFPVVAYVAQAEHHRARGRDAALHPGAPHRPSPMQIRPRRQGDGRRAAGHKVGGTALDVAGWLEDRLLIPPAPGEPAEPAADGDLG
jgi:hypothetical protein